ncbi:MAG: wax ester/triacylglycerol synthase family O-acyltransferase [Rhodoblastus sp.]|nr:wax ester/triacylglycerol synthase family O-acyltransferase [Rhodoblastus sp.]MCO5086408.1 wax ester/triacylglycerol synthase family O-acyltransferase [Methylobacteriaceae bacterium]
MSAGVKLSSVDGSFLYLETPETPMHVGSMAIFKLPEGYKGDFFEEFKAQIQARLHLAPVLRWKLERTPLDIDNPSWVEDDQFDIDRHIFRASLAAPHDRATLERIVGWMHAKLLNRARPLWEFYVFEGMANNEVGLYSKMHHSLIDGGAGAALTEIVYGDGNVSQTETKKADTKKNDPIGELFTGYASLWAQPLGLTAQGKLPDILTGKRQDLGSILMDGFARQLRQPFEYMKALPEVAKALSSVAGKLREGGVQGLKDAVAPSTPLNRTVSSERSFAAVSVSMSRCKAVAAASGGKLNDVVMALSSGMLRRYLQKVNALPDRPLRAAVPISLREAGNSEANNQVFGMICSLASDIADPRERLAKIIEESKKSKGMADPFKPIVPKLTQFSALGAPIFIQILSLLYSRTNLADVMPTPANVTISNVPGSRKPLYVAGAELQHIFPVSIAAHGLALNITVQGYRDQLDFGLIAGANVLPELRSLANMLPEELEALEAAYGLAPPAGEVVTMTAAQTPARAKTAKAPSGDKPVRKRKAASKATATGSAAG